MTAVPGLAEFESAARSLAGVISHTPALPSRALSDVAGVPVVRPKVTETTALGAAYLAGLAVGFWKSPSEIASQWQADARFKPVMKPTARREKFAAWETAIRQTKAHD